MNFEHRAEHFVQYVIIRTAVVIVACSCGWESAEFKSEEEGRKDFDAHRDTIPELTD